MDVQATVNWSACIGRIFYLFGHTKESVDYTILYRAQQSAQSIIGPVAPDSFHQAINSLIIP